ncbi:MAG: hypothetical protein HYZ21_04110 [Chloroflexi bacterium]|nr:hypothetical protein [Chloroflexota bacterium]
MKKIITFAFSTGCLLSLLAACTGVPVTTQSLEAQNTPVPVATQTNLVEVTETAAQSAIAPASTPLPAEIAAPLIDSPSIIFIDMMNEIYGWGVTETEIVSTNDGGVTWYNVTPPGLTDAGYSVFPEFFDQSHAWIQIVDPNNYPNGGTLYRTSNGGVTWESIETPFSAGDMEFVDPNNGWMMADLGVGAGSMAIAVFQTTDGGATWNRTYTNDPNLEGAGDTLPLGGIKVMLVPLDMSTAWIGGVIYSSGSTYLFRTDDNGRTWSQVSMMLPGEAQSSELTIEKIKFSSPTQGILAIRMTSATLETILYTTNNGGETWEPALATLPSSGMLEIPSAQEMIFYYNNQFYVTKDAASTFEIIDPNIAFGESLTDMSFVNSSSGWVVTTSPTNQRTLYKTTDGGRTWSPINP